MCAAIIKRIPIANVSFPCMKLHVHTQAPVLLATLLGAILASLSSAIAPNFAWLWSVHFLFLR